MSRLVQTGYNPKYPKVIERYWQYTEQSAPPSWLTDNSLIERIKEFPVLSVIEHNDGRIAIRSVNQKTPLVTLGTKDSFIFQGPDGVFGSMTPKQKELLYEEKN